MWVDKYRPSTLCDLAQSTVESHRKTANLLSAYLSISDFNHLLLCGMEGSGKKTFTKAIINNLFPLLNEKPFLQSFKKEHSSDEVQISGLQSEHHIEVDVSLMDTVDAQKNMLHLVEARITTLINDETNLIIIKNVDYLLKVSQHALLKLMEQNIDKCKFILSCESSCKLIKPLRSRVIILAIARPTNDELKLILENILLEEQISKYNKDIFDEIILFANRNVSLAILSLQNFIRKDRFIISGWKQLAQTIVQQALCEENDIRTSLEVLVDAGIPGAMIVKYLLFYFLENCNEHQHLYIQYAAKYEHRMVRGKNIVFHLEAFICKISLSMSKNVPKRMV